jgi:hypothetical protein
MTLQHNEIQILKHNVNKTMCINKWSTWQSFVCRLVITITQKYEDTKEVIRSHQPKDRQRNYQNKRRTNDIQSNTQFLFNVWHPSCFSIVLTGLHSSVWPSKRNVQIVVSLNICSCVGCIGWFCTVFVPLPHIHQILASIKIKIQNDCKCWIIQIALWIAHLGKKYSLCYKYLHIVFFFIIIPTLS